MSHYRTASPFGVRGRSGQHGCDAPPGRWQGCPAQRRASSGVAEDLDGQRCVTEGIWGRQPPARRTVDSCVARGLEHGGRVLESADAPERSSTPDERADRELAARRSMLDIAVGEAEQKNRRARNASSVIIETSPSFVTVSARTRDDWATTVEFVRVLDLVLPERCAVCNVPGDALCRSCRAALTRLVPPVCERCGSPGPWPVRRCAECAGRRLAFV